MTLLLNMTTASGDRLSPSSSISLKQSRRPNVPLKKRHNLRLSAFASTILKHVTPSACASGDADLPASSASLPTVEFVRVIQDDSSVSAQTEITSALSNKRPRSEMTFSHEYQRDKAHKGRGFEQQFTCGYCKRVKTSSSSCTDGRVRVRCECGGSHLDSKPRMHATWTPVENSASLPPPPPSPPQLLPPRPEYTVHKNLIFVDETLQQGPPLIQGKLFFAKSPALG